MSFRWRMTHWDSNITPLASVWNKIIRENEWRWSKRSLFEIVKRITVGNVKSFWPMLSKTGVIGWRQWATIFTYFPNSFPTYSTFVSYCQCCCLATRHIFTAKPQLLQNILHWHESLPSLSLQRYQMIWCLFPHTDDISIRLSVEKQKNISWLTSNGQMPREKNKHWQQISRTTGRDNVG